MPRCPWCGSRNVKEAVYSPEDVWDGYEQRVIHTYYCKDCECEFTETETITWKVEIKKEGKTPREE